VGEDARAGRLYLPVQWLRESGIDPDAWLAAPIHGPAIAAVVRRLLDHADALYAGVDAGVARLPLGCRPGINAARFLYAAIGHQVARQGLDAVSRRAVVPRARKAWLLARALVQLVPATQGPVGTCLPAARFLVDAAAVAGVADASDASHWSRLASRVDQRAGRTIDLFERLARAERGLPGGATPS
jgi:phytoene synthase